MEHTKSLLPDECAPLLSSWDFIWSFFMYSPRVRSYLFQDFQPPVNEIIYSFQNDPIILGFDFPKKQEGWPSPLLDPPDIGELKTILKSVDNTLLGYTFGNKGIFPVMRNLYSCTKDRHYRDAEVKIRRTAYKCVSIANIECILSIEFSWMCSGVLAVATSFCGMRTSNGNGYTENVGSVMDNVQIRFFLPGEAEILKNLSACFNDYALCKPNQDNEFALRMSLPTRILSPSYHFTYNTHKLDDFNATKLLSAYSLDKGISYVVTEGTMGSFIDDKFSQCLGLKLAHQCRENDLSYSKLHEIQYDILNSIEERNMLWGKCCSMIQGSRLAGFLKCVVIEAQRPVDVQKSFIQNLSSVQYKCLFSRRGLSVQGRVQKLLNQLNLHYSKPDLDYILQTCDDRSNYFQNWNRRKRVKFRVNIPDVVSVENSQSVPGNSLINTNELISQNRVENIDLSSENMAEDYGDGLLLYEFGKPITRDNDKISFREEIDDRSTRENQEPRKSLTRHENTEAFSLKINKRPICTVETPEVDSIVPKDSTEAKVRFISSNNSNLSIYKNEVVMRSSNNSFEAEKVPKSHVDIKLFKCNQCGTVIRGKRSNLKRHILLKHCNLRQFQCWYTGCGCKFQTRINLKRHEATVHTGRPFQCPNCTRKFKRKEDVETHIHNAHEKAGPTFNCEVCGSCFEVRATLNRHKRTVHDLG